MRAKKPMPFPASPAVFPHDAGNIPAIVFLIMILS
jgi:hypothetical protein